MEMINLLPDDVKKQIRDARANKRSVNYSIIIIVVAILLALAFYSIPFFWKIVGL
jgi:t-SNARE complex subunit (syntaxin)